MKGDFNTLAPGERLDMQRLPPRLRALAWVTGKSIRWVTVRLMLEAGYIDGYRTLHQDEGHTFTSWDPHVRLDYAFVPEPFTARLRRCEVVRTIRPSGRPPIICRCCPRSMAEAQDY